MAFQKQNYFQRRTKPRGPKANERIRAPQVQVISSDGKNLGTLNTQEAIDIANNTEFGLAAGVFTNDVNQATKMASQLNGGQIYVNSWFTGSVATPFGGYKQSGYSREKGQEAIKSYLQLKNIGIQL